MLIKLTCPECKNPLIINTETFIKINADKQAIHTLQCNSCLFYFGGDFTEGIKDISSILDRMAVQTPFEIVHKIKSAGLEIETADSE